MSSIHEIADKIAYEIGQDYFGAGPLAQLRRINPRIGVPGAPALHRLLARHVEDTTLNSATNFQRWSLLVHLLALAAPDDHRGGEPLGKALFEAGFSEARLAQLLDAEPADFPVVLPRVVRFLVAKREKLNTAELAYLILNPELDDSRRRIAAAFYRAERNKNAPTA
jgi:CRISPR type I-E-associated protein CasB/Cse2